MSFHNPLGLLGLIGIPIVILIYIIKNKHTEQIVTSNYLWHLSEKFLNKKKNVSLVSGIISLLLQIIAIAMISLIIAHPIIYIPNGAKEYCFILDGSGSMNMVTEEKSRMDLGKDEIKNIINDNVLQEVLRKSKNDKENLARKILFFAIRRKMYALCILLIKLKG